MTTPPTDLATAILRPVEGTNLVPGTLGDQLAGRPTLLAFLRHSGCLFCREMVADLRASAARRAGFPAVLLVHQGTVAQGDAFLAGHWPTARAVADPGGGLYRAFGVARGGVGQMFGPRAAACGVRALAKGHGVGRKVGDGWTLPTLLVVDDGRVVWEHRGDHAGDHPDLTRLPDIVAAGAG